MGPGELFGTHVVGRANRDAGGRQLFVPRLIDHVRDTEIGNDRVAAVLQSIGEEDRRHAAATELTHDPVAVLKGGLELLDNLGQKDPGRLWVACYADVFSGNERSQGCDY